MTVAHVNDAEARAEVSPRLPLLMAIRDKLAIAPPGGIMSYNDADVAAANAAMDKYRAGTVRSAALSSSWGEH